MGIYQILQNSLHAAVTLLRAFKSKGQTNHLFILNIDVSSDFNAIINSLCEPLRSSKDTTPKSHVMLNEENIVIHLSNLSSPTHTHSRLKAENYQATLILPIFDEQQRLATLSDFTILLFEYDTTFLTEVLIEVDPRLVQFDKLNHEFQFEEKAFELVLHLSSLFSNLHIGKVNNITQATENCMNIQDKSDIDVFLKDLNELNHLFDAHYFATLSLATIRELMNMNITGNKLVMGVLTSDGILYLQNEIASFKLILHSPNEVIENNKHELQNNQKITRFPFTAEVLKCVDALFLSNFTHIAFRIDGDNLLIKLPQVHYKFTLPELPSTFLKNCKKDLNTYCPLHNEQFTEIHHKPRIKKELKAAQKLNQIFMLQTANRQVSISLLNPDGRTRIFTLLGTSGVIYGYKLHFRDIDKLINAIKGSAEVSIFTQDFKGIKKTYLEVRNGQHFYANTLIEIRQ